MQTIHGPLYCERICANSLRDLTELDVAGLMSSWAHVRGFLCSVQSAPPIPLPHSLHRLGHYWIVRDGFGGHVIHGLHQTFIPASNSTTVRGERPDSKGQWIESRQSVTSNLKERKTDLVNYPLITPPPLLLQTVHGPLYCDLFKTYCSIWWMLNLI